MCFSCGARMIPVGLTSGWCDRCQVGEDAARQPNITRRTGVMVWYDEPIPLVDHSKEHSPSPA